VTVTGNLTSRVVVAKTQKLKECERTTCVN